ncbi:alpha/beta fold hydrolase [Streptomyces sp. NPDC017082]|uniref:alpha/beta fold hydrolase n=1 Tax=Streptomyces sp. NPDC017082 TaxID=3364974 RepID=UPI0037B46C7F
MPVDWARPGGPRLDSAVARRKATDPGARIGSVVFGPGGPGDSGVERVASGIGRFSPEVRRCFGIVSFDPRGVGGSNPVTCSGGILAERPSPELKSQADFDATLAYNRRLRADCRARTGPVFDHLDTAQTVRDVDALRAALGERKLAFHGSSYGTVLGAQYAESYPRRVRAMVLQADYAGLATVIAERDAGEPLPASPTSSAPLPSAVPVFCSDWHLPVRDYREYASLVAMMNRTAPDLPYVLPLHMTAACLGAPTANPQHRLDARGTPPVLVSNALHDPASGYPWAVSVARQLGRSGVLLTYAGHGHGSVTSGPCMQDAVDGYLTDLAVPSRGTVCPAVPSWQLPEPGPPRARPQP